MKSMTNNTNKLRTWTYYGVLCMCLLNLFHILVWIGEWGWENTKGERQGGGDVWG